MSKKNAREERAAKAAATLAEQQRRERNKRFAMIGGVLVVLIAVVVALTIYLSGNDANKAIDAQPAGTGQFGVTIGDDDAPNSVIIYEDFHCIHCATLEKTTRDGLADLAEQGKVLVEYRPFHLLSSYSERATNAFRVVTVEAGAPIGKVFHDLLFENYPGNDEVSDDRLVELAVEAGAEESAVRPGIEGMTEQEWVAKVTTAAREANVSGTPTVLLNNQVFQDGSTSEELGENLLLALE